MKKKHNYETYKITCLTCLQVGKKNMYEGETGRNAFTQGQEHQQGLSAKSEKSPLWKRTLTQGGQNMLSYSE